MVAAARTVTSRLLIVVAAAVVPQALLASLLMIRYAHDQRSEYLAQVTAVAHAAAAAADTEMSVLLATARTLGRSETLQRGDWSAFLDQARAVADRTGQWRIVLVDASGQEVVNTQRPFGTPLPRMRPELISEPLRTHRPTVTPMIRCALDGTWMIGVMQPVEQAAGGPAVLALLIAPRHLAERLRMQHLPPHWTAAVIDSSGAIVARVGQAEDADRAGWPAPSDSLLPTGAAAEGQTITYLPNGAAMLTGYARAPGTGWLLGVRVPEAEAMAPLHQSMRLIGACGLAISLLAVALALHYARGIGRAVDVLADAAAALEAGTVPPRIDVTLRAVQAAHERIRAAAARLIGQEADRSALLAQLEDRVAARTKELMISEQRFRLLAENATDLIVRTDGDGAFRYVSPAAEVLAMARPEALLGKRLRDLALVTDLPQVASFEQAVLDGATTMRCTFRLRPLDGRVIWVEAAGHRIRDDADGTDGAVIALRDISERKAAEERVARAASEARAADRAKSEFLARMSHELRTPLNAVNGFAEVLLQDPTLKPVHRDWVGHIVSGARQLLRLIEDVLDLARIESGRLKVVISSIEIAPLIEEAAHMLAPAAEARRINLVAAPAPQGTTVLADRARLLQVLLNLVSNAIKYNRLGGNVRISVAPPAMASGDARPGPVITGAVATGAIVPGPMVRLTVADDGPGIAAGRLSDIFQPLQPREPGRSAAEGTGIGLAITRQLVGLMRGMISVESQPGQGATFHVDLPVGTPSAAAGGDGLSHPQWGPGAPFTVLYIEDTEAAIQLMQAIFAFVPGVRLITARTAVDGLRLARETRPDCVITDIRLPDLDGFEVLAALRADPLTAEVPVLAVSGEAMPGAVAHGRDAGFFAYITKPFRLNELSATLDTLRRERPAPQPATEEVAA